MKQCILGISSFGHDTSACIVDTSNAETIFASAQERYSNIKYDDTIPFYTISKCIEIAEKLNYKIRDLSLEKVPYIAVIGEKEILDQTVSLRSFPENKLVSMQLNEFLKKIKNSCSIE